MTRFRPSGVRLSGRRAFVCSATALLALVAAAPVALADATIDHEALDLSVKNSRKLTIEVPVTMANRGTVTLSGTLGGVEVPPIVQKFKTKEGVQRTRTMRFKVDAKKLGITDAPLALLFIGDVDAREEGQAEPTTASVETVIPLPLILLPGLANELPSDRKALVPFVGGLGTAVAQHLGHSSSPWQTKGRNKTAFVQNYDSLSDPLEKSAAKLAKKADKLIRKTPFGRINVIAHSTGGLVARRAMVPSAPSAKPAPSLDGKVASLFMLGTPNSGVPLAYVAREAVVGNATSVVGPILDGIKNESIDGLDALLLNRNFLHVVELFLPTMPFARLPDPAGPQGATILIGMDEINALRPRNAAVSEELLLLNVDNDPDPGTRYYGAVFTDVETAAPIGTVAGIDVTVFLAGGGVDLTSVEPFEGPGDGLTLRDSLMLTSHPNWAEAITLIDLGTGSHGDYFDLPSVPALTGTLLFELTRTSEASED